MMERLSASRGIGIWGMYVLYLYIEYSVKKARFISDEVPCILAMAPKIAKLEMKSETGYSVRRVCGGVMRYCQDYMQEYNKLAEKDKRDGMNDWAAGGEGEGGGVCWV